MATPKDDTRYNVDILSKNDDPKNVVLLGATKKDVIYTTTIQPVRKIDITTDKTIVDTAKSAAQDLLKSGQLQQTVSNVFSLELESNDLLDYINNKKLLKIDNPSDIDKYASKLCYIELQNNPGTFSIAKIVKFSPKQTPIAGYDGIVIRYINEKPAKENTLNVSKINIYVNPEDMIRGGGSKRHKKTLSKKQPTYKKQKSMRKR